MSDDDARAMRTFRVEPGTDLTGQPAIAYLVRLMMCVDSMRSTFRWLYTVNESTDTESHRNRMWAFVASAGRAGEAMRVLKQGLKAGHIDRSMLGDDPKLLEVWDDLTSPNPSEFIRLAHRVRDNYFAHWDDTCRAANALLVALSTSAKPLPFIVTTEGGDYMQTWFPWAAEAVAGDVLGDFDADADGDLLQELGAFIGTVCNIVSTLAGAVFGKLGLPFESADD